MYVPKREQGTFVQLDHAARRRERELGEVAEAAKKVGISRAQVDESLLRIQALLPDLSPNLDRLKASDWVSLVSGDGVNKVAAIVITLKSHYPGADVSSMIVACPRILLRTQQQVNEDALEIQGLIAGRLPNLDAVVEAVPDLLRPAQMQLSLSNLRAWFPKQDPFQLLSQNPRLLKDIEEADLEADPTYDWEST